MSKNNYPGVVKHFAVNLKDNETAAKAGYDLLMGLNKGDIDARFKAWVRYIKEVENNEPHVDSQRDGVWVPAIEED